MAGVMLHYGLRYCFESPPPPGLQPLLLPETVVPVSSKSRWPPGGPRLLACRRALRVSVAKAHPVAHCDATPAVQIASGVNGLVPPPHIPRIPYAPRAADNAIILGLTADVQRNIALSGGAPGGPAAAAAAGGQAGPGQGGAYGQRPGHQQYQQQQQQPYGGGRGGPYGGGRGPGAGRMPYNGPAGGRGGGGGGYGGRGPYQGPYGAAAGAGAGPGPMAAAAAAAAAAVRAMPLVPAIDTLHCFTAFAGGAAAGARPSLPMVVRQLISQATATEAIRRAEAVRACGMCGCVLGLGRCWREHGLA